MYCGQCGKEIADGSNFCTYCGAEQNRFTVRSGYAASLTPMKPAVEKEQRNVGMIVLAVITAILSLLLIFVAGWISTVGTGLTGLNQLTEIAEYMAVTVAIAAVIGLIVTLIRRKIAKNRSKSRYLLSVVLCLLTVTILSFARVITVTSLKNMAEGSVKSGNFVSAKSKQSPKMVLVNSADGSVSISVPDNWKTKDADIDPTATIAVSNKKAAQYLEVIDVPKSETAADYSINAYMSDFQDEIRREWTDLDWTYVSQATLGGADALSVNFSGTKDDVNAYYWVYIVDGRSDYYVIVGWTSVDMADKNKPVMEKVINSFKEY